MKINRTLMSTLTVALFSTVQFATAADSDPTVGTTPPSNVTPSQNPESGVAVTPLPQAEDDSSRLPATSLSSSRSMNSGTNATSPEITEVFSELIGSQHLRGAALIGSDVVDNTGKEVGKVADLAVSQNGELTGVLISSGGFLGVGDRLVALPWTSFDTLSSGKKLKLRLNDAQLAQVPALDDISDDGLTLKLKYSDAENKN